MWRGRKPHRVRHHRRRRLCVTSPLEQKIKVSGPMVVTANRLADGAVIFRTADGRWSTQLGSAAIVSNPTAARELLAGAVADDVGAVGAYLAPVNVSAEGAVRPGNLRERVRVAGPTFELPAAASAR